jgi:maltose alpha-D-glucosyltransferase/alpha-amylase
VNVAQQRREPESLLNWVERRIRMRKECPEFGWGDFTVLRLDVAEVLAIRYDFRGVSMLTLHNFSSRRQSLTVDPKTDNSGLLVDVFDNNHSRSENGMHEVALPPYGHRWYRVGAPDNVPNRTSF